MEMTPDNPIADLHPLPCGRTVEDVWTELDAHEHSRHLADCPHCRTARLSLEQLAAATQLLIDDPVVVPTGLLDRIMTAVRADLDLGRTISLPAGPAQVDLSLSALAAVLRYAVDGVPGVRARQCRVEPSEAGPGAVRVSMTIALKYGTGRVAALEEARGRATLALRGKVGLELDTLDFEVVDIWMDEQ